MGSFLGPRFAGRELDSSISKPIQQSPTMVPNSDDVGPRLRSPVAEAPIIVQCVVGEG